MQAGLPVAPQAQAAAQPQPTDAVPASPVAAQFDAVMTKAMAGAARPEQATAPADPSVTVPLVVVPANVSFGVAVCQAASAIKGAATDRMASARTERPAVIPPIKSMSASGAAVRATVVESDIAAVGMLADSAQVTSAVVTLPATTNTLPGGAMPPQTDQPPEFAMSPQVHQSLPLSLSAATKPTGSSAGAAVQLARSTDDQPPAQVMQPTALEPSAIFPMTGSLAAALPNAVVEKLADGVRSPLTVAANPDGKASQRDGASGRGWLAELVPPVPAESSIIAPSKGLPRASANSPAHSAVDEGAVAAIGMPAGRVQAPPAVAVRPDTQPAGVVPPQASQPREPALSPNAVRQKLPLWTAMAKPAGSPGGTTARQAESVHDQPTVLVTQPTAPEPSVILPVMGSPAAVLPFDQNPPSALVPDSVVRTTIGASAGAHVRGGASVGRWPVQAAPLAPAQPSMIPPIEGLAATHAIDSNAAPVPIAETAVAAVGALSPQPPPARGGEGVAMPPAAPTDDRSAALVAQPVAPDASVIPAKARAADGQQPDKGALAVFAFPRFDDETSEAVTASAAQSATARQPVLSPTAATPATSAPQALPPLAAAATRRGEATDRKAGVQSAKPGAGANESFLSTTTPLPAGPPASPAILVAVPAAASAADPSTPRPSAQAARARTAAIENMSGAAAKSAGHAPPSLAVPSTAEPQPAAMEAQVPLGGDATDAAATASPARSASPLVPDLSAPTPAAGTQAPAAATSAPATTSPGPTVAAPTEHNAPVLVSTAHGPDGAQRLTVRLDPPELGHVQIRIDRPTEAPARVEITVERAETLTLLLRDQPQLQRALDAAGVPAEGRSRHLPCCLARASAVAAQRSDTRPHPRRGRRQPERRRLAWRAPTGRPAGTASAGRRTGHRRYPVHADRAARLATRRPRHHRMTRKGTIP